LGLVLAVPAVGALVPVAAKFGARAQLPAWLLAASAGVTMTTALLSGLSPLRALRRTEPATLLR
jgi:hypothetical protein